MKTFHSSAEETKGRRDEGLAPGSPDCCKLRVLPNGPGASSYSVR